jgi:thioredoxin reductase (NADPH)
MAQLPALIVVDDEVEVLRAIARDLRRHYGEDYRILRAQTGEEVLQTCADLEAKGGTVALVLSDQRMPGLSGVDVLERVAPLFPDAKRVLLTAYADTDAAIRAINTAGIDYYLLKPWDPPEECLYPVLDDLLADWKAAYRPQFQGTRVVGNRWSPDTHRVKDFLSRHQIPYRWLDVEHDEAARKAIDVHTTTDGPPALPLVLMPEGGAHPNPPTPELARIVGLQTEAQRPYYDLVIVGGGPAGLASAVYGASEGLRTLLVEAEAPGGQAGTSSRIENYLGFPSGLSGSELSRRAVAQARKFEVEILAPVEAEGLRSEDDYHIVTLSNGSEVASHALVISSGVQYRKLDVPGVEALSGRGVYYGAAQAEAVACQDEDVFIVGAGNSAGQGAMHLSGYARNVTLLVRGDGLERSMSHYLIDQITSTPNIHVRTGVQVRAAHGSDHLEALTLEPSRGDGEAERVPADALFVFIGAAPRTDWLGDAIDRDDRGFILTGESARSRGGWLLERPPFLLETCRPGIFAAGDVRAGSVKRVASGVGEGSVAISFVHQHLAQF